MDSGEILQKEEDKAIEDGIRFLEEEPTITWGELHAELKEKFAWE
jgi:hypothetical protein